MLTIKIELCTTSPRDSLVEDTKENASNQPILKVTSTKLLQAEGVGYENIYPYERYEGPVGSRQATKTLNGHAKGSHINPTHAMRLWLSEDGYDHLIIESPAVIYVMNEQGKTVDKITV